MTVRRIIPEDSLAALTDALTDLLHIHEGDVSAVADAVQVALNTARELHYPAERDGEMVTIAGGDDRAIGGASS